MCLGAYLIAKFEAVTNAALRLISDRSRAMHDGGKGKKTFTHFV